VWFPKTIFLYSREVWSLQTMFHLTQEIWFQIWFGESIWHTPVRCASCSKPYFITLEEHDSKSPDSWSSDVCLLQTFHITWKIWFSEPTLQ
jgi:hypothetical protein